MPFRPEFAPPHFYHYEYVHEEKWLKRGSVYSESQFEERHGDGSLRLVAILHLPSRSIVVNTRFQFSLTSLSIITLDHDQRNIATHAKGESSIFS